MRTFVGAAVMLTASVVGAQARASAATPRAVADSFFAAIDRAAWERAATYLDSGAVARQLRERVRRARVELPTRQPTAEELMADDPTMPRAVAEWRVRENGRFRPRAFRDYSDEYARVTTFEALQALSPREAGARWLEATDPSTRMRRLLAEVNCPRTGADSLPAINPYRVSTIAEAPVDDSTAYVLARTGFGSDSPRLEDRMPPHLVLLLRQQGVWRIVPTPDLLSGGLSIGVGGCTSGEAEYGSA